MLAVIFESKFDRKVHDIKGNICQKNIAFPAFCNYIKYVTEYQTNISGVKIL